MYGTTHTPVWSKISTRGGYIDSNFISLASGKYYQIFLILEGISPDFSVDGKKKIDAAFGDILPVV